VTARSDYQSRQLIRRSLKAGAKTIVTGCYAQVSPDEILKIDKDIFIFSNYEKYNIIKKLTDNIVSSNLYYSKRSRPFIKVQDGCNMKCSYCIVPMARGRARSISKTEILNQIKYLVSMGYHEVVLTGIHLGSYGTDLKQKTNLAALIKCILRKTKINRIRLSSLELREINDEILELLEDRRLCKHLHIPLQSGDSSILHKMKRVYNANYYKNIIDVILKRFPGICIGSDVIVGFPGEGNVEFMRTKKLIESLPISYLHIFPFSPRKNTLAFSEIPQIVSNKKRERYKILNELNSRKREEYMKSQIGKDLDIIIEEKLDDNTIMGTSGNYQKVRIKSQEYEKKSLMHVRVIGIEKKHLITISLKNIQPAYNKE
jgi:threonylcarbamoyladenosine tRNA methylthiotransferase MtaB